MAARRGRVPARVATMGRVDMALALLTAGQLLAAVLVVANHGLG